MNRLAALAILSATTACVTATSTAQATVFGYSGGTYTQNFDTLPASLPANSTALTGRGPHALNDAFEITTLVGWWGANHRGSNSNTEFRAHNGSLAGNQGRGVVSFGQTGSGERALGTLATSNQVNSFGLILRNDTTTVIDQIAIEFFGEQWRRGNISSSSPAVNELIFEFGVFETDPSAYAINDLLLNPPTGATIPTYRFEESLIFASPNRQDSPLEVALDGNAAQNRTFKSATLTAVNWTPGSFLTLRWQGVDISGQDDGLAIDDFKLTPLGGTTGPDLVLGDFNFDGLLDAGDIDNFITALLESDPFEQFIATFGADFAAQYGTTLTAEMVITLGDFDNNDVFDAGDIDGFVDAVLNSGRPGAAVIPEPAALGFLAPVVPLLVRRRRSA